jgi:hypothetical protein
MRTTSTATMVTVESVAHACLGHSSSDGIPYVVIDVQVAMGAVSRAFQNPSPLHRRSGGAGT